MVAFIKQEANEKAHEILIKAGPQPSTKNPYALLAAQFAGWSRISAMFRI